MIVRDLDEVKDTERDVRGTVNEQPWRSRRLLTKADNMGFSLHITEIPKNSEHHYWYQNHLESVFCIEGEGSVEEVSSGEVHKIGPGTVYALDKNDKHILRAKTDMKEIDSIFYNFV